MSIFTTYQASFQTRNSTNLRRPEFTGVGFLSLILLLLVAGRIAQAQSSPTITLTATPGTCQTATNGYTVTGTISLTNAATQSLTAGQTSASYSLKGLTSGTGLHTVTVSVTGATCTSATVTYSAPNICDCPNPGTLTGCTVAVKPIRINMGPASLTVADGQGRTFQSYTNYKLEGTLNANLSTISNTNTGGPNGTSSQPLYQRGLTANEGYLNWHFAIPDGSYTVLIHYA